MAVQTFTIPEHDEDFDSGMIQLNLDTKQATVHVVRRTTGNTMTEMKVIEVIPLFQAELTTDEIAAFRKGVNLIVATAWDKTLSDITGDLL